MQITIDEKNYFATVDTLWLAMQGECNTRGYLLTIQKYREQQIIFFERNCRI